MMAIPITDNVGLDLGIELEEDGDIEQIFDKLKKFQIGSALEDLQGKTIGELTDDVKELTIGFDIDQPIDIGGDDDEVSFTVNAGASFTLNFLDASDGQLFKEDPYDDPITIDDGEHWATATIEVTLGAGLEMKDKATLGFELGKIIEIGSYAPLEAGMPLLQAIKTTLDAFTIPRSVASVSRMPGGTIATVSGIGRLEFSAEADLFAATNPLASADLPVGDTTFDLSAGGSFNVGADFGVAGEFQARIRRFDTVGDNGSTERKAHFGFLKKKGTTLSVSATAKYGLGASVAGFELTEKILGAIGGQSEDAIGARKQLFAAGGLADGDKIELLKDIEATVKASIDTHLEVSLGMQWNSSQTGTRAFAFEAAFEQLTAAGTSALERAFRGDLSEIPEDKQQAADMGLALLRRLRASTKTSGHALQVNLLGIFNFRSVEEMTLSSVVIHNDKDGSLTITDEATAKRIATKRINIFVAKDDKLREALAEHFLVTAMYRGSRLAIVAPQLTSRHVYFEYHTDTNAAIMKDNLDVAEALGLLEPEQKKELLAGTTDFGKSTLHASVDYDHEVFRSLFVDSSNNSLGSDAYERVGRMAFTHLMQQGDSRNDYRRLVADDAEWARMKSRGQAGFRDLFGALDDLQIGVLRGDYSVIVWWAEAMAKASEAIVEIESFFANGTPSETDEGFQKARGKLAHHLRDVASNARKRFGEPWGLVAMDLAGGQRADARVTIDWEGREEAWSKQRGAG